MKYIKLHDIKTNEIILFNIEQIVTVKDNLVITSSAISFEVRESLDQIVSVIDKYS